MKKLSQGEIKSLENVIEDKNQLKLLLVQKADEQAQDRFADKNIDRQYQIFELQSGKIVNLAEEREKEFEIFAQKMSEYEVRVPEIFYKLILKLKGEIVPEGRIYQKPHYMARITNEIIYGRFNKDVLPKLQRLNPYVRVGLRYFKHFQFLSENGKVLFDSYINDAIEVMKDSSDWYSFRIKHSQKFGVTFQLNWEKEFSLS